MATVDKEFADNIARNNGYYNGDDDNSLGDNPRVIKIVKYINIHGIECFGLIFPREDRDKYFNKDFCFNPQIYWEYK